MLIQIFQKPIWVLRSICSGKLSVPYVFTDFSNVFCSGPLRHISNTVSYVQKRSTTRIVCINLVVFLVQRRRTQGLVLELCIRGLSPSRGHDICEFKLILTEERGVSAEQTSLLRNLPEDNLGEKSSCRVKRKLCLTAQHRYQRTSSTSLPGASHVVYIPVASPEM